MLDTSDAGDQRIERRNVGSDTQRRLNKSGRTGARTACASRGAAGARSRSARSEAANPTAGRSLHHTGIYAAKRSTGLGAQNICIRDRQVVTCDGEVEVVFQCQRDGIL